VKSRQKVKGGQAAVPCLGHLSSLESILGEHEPDMVILADLSGPRGRGVGDRESVSSASSVLFAVVAPCFRIFISGLQLRRQMAGTPIAWASAACRWTAQLNVMLKRTVDLVGGMVGLLLSAPVALALFGSIVWLECRGSIFYRQVCAPARMASRSSVFEIRSMKLNAGGETALSGARPTIHAAACASGPLCAPWNIDEAAAVLERAEGRDELGRPAS